jgi:hypothetical protein
MILDKAEYEHAKAESAAQAERLEMYQTSHRRKDSLRRRSGDSWNL